MTVKLKYGNTNTFFINGLLFDTDMPGTLTSFFKVIKQNNLCAQDINYVLCSHYHPDHMGLVGELIDLGIHPLVIQNQKDFIHSSDVILKRQFGEKYKPIKDSDITVLSDAESRNFLNSIGVQGEIKTTSSHSPDGIALFLDNGDCFVGDVEPYQFIEGYADNQSLKDDWSMIMGFNPKVIYYGHNREKHLS